MYGNEDYEKELRMTIKRCLMQGYNDLESILPHAGGADARTVRKMIDEIKNTSEFKQFISGKDDEQSAQARRLSAMLPLSLPSPDPIKSQWWFTLDTMSKLSTMMWELSSGNPVAFIGAPTVGYYYSHRYNSDILVLDADKDVLNCLKLPKYFTKLYNVYDELSQEIQKKYSVVLIDPPWYPEDTELFIHRAHSLLLNTGFIICILPPRLTRPGIIQQRTQLLKKLLDSNFEIISIETEFVNYSVPTFEEKAFNDIDGFNARSWRLGDLLIIKTTSTSKTELPKDISKKEVITYSIDPKKLRVFMFDNSKRIEMSEWLKPVEGFVRNISTRMYNKNEISIWTSNHNAIICKDSNIIKVILEGWSSGKLPTEIVNDITSFGITVDEAKTIINEVDKHLLIWKDNVLSSYRKTPEQILRTQSECQSELATTPTDREHEFKSDGYRIEFQRDRDRILWSHSLKRLANKCQVFPVQSDDNIRRRLSHSIEVMQLASTICISFGLDRDLTEAGALVHDIGHTPFGHAGEYALSKTLNDIVEEFGGFNHYEHGVDVVRWLEDVYKSTSAGGFPGLNLTKETIECIIKHTYFRNNQPLSQTTLINNSKHKDLLDDTNCHLEGQAIRIADKVSYLISDLEDGIRMGVFKLEHFKQCKFFDRPPIDMSPAPGDTLYEHFISQRRSILKVIMEDILNYTDKKLSELKTIDCVRKSSEYAVDFSPNVKAEITEIWRKLQSAILHKDSRVIAANMRATKIISNLLYLFALYPQLVESKFRKSHDKLKDSNYVKFYTNKVGDTLGIPKRLLSPYSYEKIIGSDVKSQGDNFNIPTYNLILAKDYVASLTDTSALNEYNKHLGIVIDS